MKKYKLKKIISAFFVPLMILPLMIGFAKESDIALAKSDSDSQNKFPFDENILLSVFWPPTENYINDEQYKLMADAGIRWVMGSGEESLSTPENQAKMLKLCAKYGMGMTISDGNFGNSLLNKTEEEIAAAVKRYENVPAAEGFYIRDEPINPNIFLDAYIALKKAAPHKYMHLNFLPNIVHPIKKMYKAQMNDWCRLTAEAGYPIEYLMFDKYPFPLEEGKMDRTEFFSNVRYCYEVGLENDVKTGLYIQTVCQEVLFRRPTDTEIRYEMYAALAFGFKQLSFFTWFTPSNRSEPFKDGIISADGKPNAHYETIKKINKEILTIGSTLVKCDALEVYFSGKNTYGQPRVPDGFFVEARKEDDVILSFLRHKETGRNYLMVVNNDFSQSQNVELTFDESIKSLCEISKTDGSSKSLKMDGQKLNLELSAGDGMFIALPEDFDHYQEEEEGQPEAKTNLAINSMITAPESLGEDGWYISCLQDGTRKSKTNINGWKTQDTDSTYVKIDLRRNLNFNRIDLYPTGSIYERGNTLPSEISVSVSEDGKNYTEIKTLSDTKIDYLKGIQIDLPSSYGRYIRLDMKGSNGGSYISLNEIEIYNDDGSVPAPEEFDPPKQEAITYKKGSNIALKKKVFCSSITANSYNTAGCFVNDGKSNTGWSSQAGLHQSPDASEFIAVDFGDLFAVKKITLKALECFPEDYCVELSENGVDWTEIEKVKSAPDYKSGKIINISLESPTTARYLRVTGTKLRKSDNGYIFKLGEIEAYGNPVCDKTELENIIDEYLSKGGNKSADQYKNAQNGAENEFLTQTQADSLVKELSVLVDAMKDQSSDNSESFVSSETDSSNENLSEEKNNSLAKIIITVLSVLAVFATASVFVIYKRKNK